LIKHQATKDNLAHIYLELNQVSVIPKASYGKTAVIEALKKMSPVLEKYKNANSKLEADYMHSDDPKVSYQMLQCFEKDRIADLLYS
jgi:hypothetical protein